MAYQNQAMAVGNRQNVYKRRLTKEEKKRLKCKHCHETGHEMEECFKLHGVPEWYKKYKENMNRYQENFADNMEDTSSAYSGFEQRSSGADISKVVQAEIAKYLASLGNQNVPTSTTQGGVSMVQTKAGEQEFFDRQALCLQCVPKYGER